MSNPLLAHKHYSVRSRHGTTTVFLGIVLSALVLVECTFLVFVWNLNYQMTVNQAIKAQTECILSDYNRQLFNVYGIYAFFEDSVNDDIFRRVIEANGYEEGDRIEAFGVESISTDDLRAAISGYYSYRSSGILFSELIDCLSGMIDSLDQIGVCDAIKDITSSDSAGYVQNILSGASTVDGLINTAADTDKAFNGDEYCDEANDCSAYQESVVNADNDLESLNIGIDITDFGSVLNCLDSFINIKSDISDDVMTVAFHPLCAHYAAYNFDCNLSNDCDSTINGTGFSEIHGSNNSDSEYILTGLSGPGGTVFIAMMIYATVFTKNIINDFADEELRAVLDGVSAAISAIIGVVSCGTVVIDPEILTTVMIVIKAAAESVKTLIDVLNGEEFTLLEFENVGAISLGYRDFIFAFMLFVPDDKMMNRIITVLRRDYGQMYTRINMQADINGIDYSIDKGYTMYNREG